METIAKGQDLSVDFDGLSNAISLTQKATSKLQSHAQEVLEHLAKLSPRAGTPHLSLKSRRKDIIKVFKEIKRINKKLTGFESGFLSTEGIKEREWYKHKGTAPGKVRATAEPFPV